jgi:hypothetical protein
MAVATAPIVSSVSAVAKAMAAFLLGDKSEGLPEGLDA